MSTESLVAPFTGAWIEIFVIGNTTVWGLVAPFTGAWIEIARQRCQSLWPDHSSHPSRVRGLKSQCLYDPYGADIVAPFTGAWIEI